MIYLIKHGADVSERDDANKIPLHYACEEKLDQVINVLLQHGSKFEDDGVTYSESVEEIFKNPESFSGVFQVEFINAKNDDEKTLLHIALENSSEKALKDVLDAHRDHLKSRKRGTREYKSYSFTSLNAKDKEGKTPLMIAIEKRNSLAVQELIKCGVIFDTENLNSSEENIAQQIDNVKKIFDNFEKTTEIFEIQNDFKDVRNAQGETPLHFAVKFKNYSMLTKAN
uniref:Ankyrin repeat protein n=1 Tax=Panagrolaimus superbus TaxID=310955 RepID=A0A914XZ94_9BILA